jgi:hypothetical protein
MILTCTFKRFNKPDKPAPSRYRLSGATCFALPRRIMSGRKYEKSSLGVPEFEEYDEFRFSVQTDWHFKKYLAISLIAASLLLWKLFPMYYWRPGDVRASVPYCPQETPLGPASNIFPTLEATYATEAFRNLSALWLSGAVQIPSVHFALVRVLK